MVSFAIVFNNIYGETLAGNIGVVSLFIIPACIALFIKLYILYSVYGDTPQHTVFTAMLSVFACHNICEVMAYIYFFHGSFATSLVRAYYLISLVAMMHVCAYAIEVSKVSVKSYIKITAIVFVFCQSMLILFSDLLITGSESMGYTLTATHGPLYFLFTISVCSSMLFIAVILPKGYRITSDALAQIQCLYTLCAIAPLIMVGPIVILLQSLDWNINTAMLLPFASTFYLIIVVLGERSHKLTDIRAFLPFSSERKAARKLIKMYGSFSTHNASFKNSKDEIERALILYVLEKNRYNVLRSAEVMNVSRSTVYSVCKRLNIKIDDHRSHTKQSNKPLIKK